MITIDGSAGEGGGQILRYACALSLITGQPMRVTGIRGGRPKPGLMRQHLTSLEAACTIGTATCEGLAVGSTEIIFHPGKIVPGEYHFAVGTAGSTGLVLQTLLMPLLLADKPSRLVLEGGTHALAAPPFDFTARTLIPILNRMGPQIDARLVRPGFYPRGGGQIEVSVTPAPLRPVSCCERGALQALSAKALYAGIPADIAAREIRCVRSQMGLDEQQTQIEELPPDQGPGNALLLEARFDQVTEIVAGFGQLGVPAEQIAKTAVARMQGYLTSNAVVGPYLADQLLLPFALANGGSFTTVKPSAHSLSAAAIIRQFLGRDCRFVPQSDGTHLMTVAPTS